MIEPEPQKRRDKRLAILLALVIPGLGHFYVGRDGYGAAIMLAALFLVLGYVATQIASVALPMPSVLMFLVFMTGFWVFQVVDLAQPSGLFSTQRR